MSKTELEWHPVAALFSLMGDEDLTALAEHIREHGQMDPILVDDQRRIVDGRNRYLACQRLGIEPNVASINGSDPLEIAVGRNLRRKERSTGERAIAAARAWPLYAAKRGGDRRSVDFQDARTGHFEKTRDVLARKFGVGKDAIQQARALVERDGVAADAVAGGEKTLAQAYDELRQREFTRGLEAQQLAEVIAADPALAAAISAGALTLAQAREELAKREERDRLERYAATQNVFTLLSVADLPATEEHLRRMKEVIDLGATGPDGKKITLQRLRRAAAYTAALAEVLGGENA